MSRFKRADLAAQFHKQFAQFNSAPAERVKIDPEAAAIMLKEVQGYLSPDKPTIQRIYDNVHMAIHGRNQACAEEDRLNVPSRETVRREIRALDPFYVEVARNGEAAARKKFFPVKWVTPND